MWLRSVHVAVLCACGRALCMWLCLLLVQRCPAATLSAPATNLHPPLIVSVLAGDAVVTAAGVQSPPFRYTFQSSAESHVVGSVAPLTGPTLGGAVLTISGTKFGDNATALFVERNRTGGLTGARLQCAWRGELGIHCSDSTIRYVVQPSGSYCFPLLPAKSVNRFAHQQCWSSSSRPHSPRTRWHCHSL
jgi:hypothetical protein